MSTKKLVGKTDRRCKGCSLDPSIESILRLCARSQAHPLFHCQLTRESDQIRDWSTLPRQAERHGLAPLAYLHLNEVNALIPIFIQRELRGLYLRHRLANEVLAHALVEILQAFQTMGIESLILKGAALAHLVYPLPGLRPMKDLDILVHPTEALRAQSILLELGYRENQSSFPESEQQFHLPPMIRLYQGMQVSVEIHNNLFPEILHHNPHLFEQLSAARIPFQVNGTPAFTLGWEDMLWHLHAHTFGLPSQLNQAFSLIGVADMISVVEKFWKVIDWGRVRRSFPRVYNALPLLHYLTPWSDEVIFKLDLPEGTTPHGVIREYQGWPVVPYRIRGRQNLLAYLRETFFPSDWWLRAHYGSAGMLALLFDRWIQHPVNVIRWVAKRLIKPTKPSQHIDKGEMDGSKPDPST